MLEKRQIMINNDTLEMPDEYKYQWQTISAKTHTKSS